MPEIAEVARAVHFIRKHLVGRTLSKVTAIDDANVFGKVGTSGAEITEKLTGRKVVSAGQQGKYFWMIMDTPPHPVMHFGMAGWLKFKSEHTYYYRKKDTETEENWPPKFWKVLFETDGEGTEKVEAAYVDMRRFGRVRLVNCKADEIRNVSPLVENGPDPVVDKDIVTVEWLRELCAKKKVPIKAMLLDQANVSGIGNWVGDEVMYHAGMHPEQYANTLSEAQIKQLHASLHYICSTAVDLLADTDNFPEDWLFKHRWGKGKKDAPNTMPNGEKIVFLTVGGRTSAVVPSKQKKTGPVAKDLDEAVEDVKPKKGALGKRVVEDDADEKPKANVKRARKATKPDPIKEDEEDESASEQEAPPPKRKAKANGSSTRKATRGSKSQPMKVEPTPRSKATKDAPKEVTRSSGKAKKGTEASKTNGIEEGDGRRRSGRLQK